MGPYQESTWNHSHIITPAAAISELLKIAWDADATVVKVSPESID